MGHMIYRSSAASRTEIPMSEIKLIAADEIIGTCSELTVTAEPITVSWIVPPPILNIRSPLPQKVLDLPEDLPSSRWEGSNG